ncbi:SpoIIE family protein phosphatase/ATP-binding protein [Actinoallomurus rhizosphaericola]|uniref:SpoIIE family protein phosphatase/ATP-binding protein n=1 Tax=Actinoallomurus rhizosphaericola TaxID=2952536 RepID=UPI00209336AD|nr:SpoIIE family protein phosphatase/ATP-binding protein [Actinoallomurus rhizosphaericola]MCO5999935.1 SpoIIE family protein phosphatase [Actinoallomurus rhizosphaericola]
MSLLSLRSVAGQVFLLQVVTVVLLVATAVTVQVVESAYASLRQGRRASVVAAQTFANAPGVAQALRSTNPTAVLQPRTEAARKRAGVDFIVVMNTHGIRYTYPYPTEIGKRFVGNIRPALHGHVTVEQAGGPPVPAGRGTYVQAVVPVFDEHGAVAGLVSAGMTVRGVTRRWLSHIPIIVGSGAVTLALAAAGAVLVSRRLRRQTHGVGPAEMTRMYEHHDAVLHAVREGVLITDADGRLVLVNDEAQRLLGLPEDAQGRDVRDLGLPEQMTRLLACDEPVTDEVHRAQDRLLSVNKRSAFPGRAEGGSVVTLRDTTELAAVLERAQVTRERLKLLYEAGVRIGTTLNVTGEARELAEVAAAGFADLVMVDLIDAVLRGEEPTAGRSRRLRRVAIAGERRITPMWPVGERVWFSSAAPQNRALEQGHGVLQADLRQARGWREESPERADEALGQGLRSLVAVPLQARGVALGVASFYRVQETPAFDNEDLLLAEELTTRAAMAIDNARRFTREHAMAVTLQRSLLPRRQPEQDALEVAWRYLPAEAGVGGDWFDLIPLPGARVALAIGDVVGHGLHAAVTMARLRTAAHNFAALDLPVEDVLWHLDELVARMDGDEATGSHPEGPGGEGVTGATCLYGVYDPVAGTCTFASAGHPGPAVVHPDSTVTYPDVPVSPPLGLGGYPFEATELRLPESACLVLYTDGLIADRTRDIDAGLEDLRRTLRHTDGRTPEETCEAVIDAIAPTHRADDIALLVARTRLFPRSHVAEWDVPADAAAVPSIRARCAEKTREWGLERVTFTTELIVSELVTNAIRYTAPPITLRLLYGRCLTCEVSDASSTAPRLRRAATTDEGGRGLFLVAQLSERWGTRYTADGKVIWADQDLGHEPTTDEGLADVLLRQFDAPLL